MKVKYKIVANFSIILIIILVMTTVSYNGLSGIKTSFAEVTGKKTPMMLAVGDITADILLVNRALIAINNVTDDVELFKIRSTEFDEISSQLDNDLAGFTSMFKTLTDQRIQQESIITERNVENLQQLSDEFIKVKSKLVANAEKLSTKNEDLLGSSEEMELTVDYLINSYEGQIVVIKSLYELRNKLRVAFEQVELLYNSNNYQTLQQTKDTVDNSIQSAKNIIKNIEEKGLVDTFEMNDTKNSFEILYDEYTEPHGFFQLLQNSVIDSNKSRMQMKEINELSNGTVIILKELRKQVSTIAKSANNSAENLINRSVVTLIILAVAAVIALLIIGILFSRSIQIPLTKINSLITQIADGNLTNQVNYTRADEFGELAGSSNKLIEKLSGMIKNIASDSKQIYHSSYIGSHLSQATTERVKQQQMQIVSIDRATQENSRATSLISENIIQMIELVKQSDGHIKDGNLIVDKTKQVLEQLQGFIDNTSGALKTVANSVSEITTVISVVENIAEQTNLLALNAAIEAARAGEQGRGFAVVADEVRSLAGKTQESTKAIDSMVSQLQAATTSSLQAMDDSVQGANSTKEQAEQIITIFANIAQAINEVSTMSGRISSAAEEQATATVEVTDNVEIISKNAEETSNMIVELNNQNQSFIAIAKDLEKSVSSFTINQ